METVIETEINFDGLNDKLRRTGHVPNLVSLVLTRGGHMGFASLKTWDPTVPKPMPGGFSGGLVPLDNVNPTLDFGTFNFVADTHTGAWQSRATGKTGANVIELWAYCLDCTLEQAAQKICQKLSISLPLVGQPID